MASSRRTYDTDSITLRTVFAKNPGNSNVPALRVLTADGLGGTYWAIPSSLGLNPSFNEIITSAATYTADLSYNKFRLLAGENIGMVDGPLGSNQTTLFAKAFNQIDVSGGNIVAAFSNNRLDSSVIFAGENGVVVRADPATNTLFFGGATSSNTTISTGIYGFNQFKVTPVASTITSAVLNWDGDFITSSSPSSIFRLIGINDIQLSTNVTTNSVFFTISTFTSKGYLDISNAAFSAYPSSLSTVSSLYVQSSLFGSTFASLSTSSGVNVSSIYSTINGAAMSTGFEILLLQGLVNARATIVQLNTEIANVNLNMRSTVTGLGSIGYISTAHLRSTVGGLGTANYISTLSLNSTLSTFSTALGFLGGGGSGDVTVANLRSTVAGLGTVDYVSTLSLYSTLSTFSTALGAFGTGSGDVTVANLRSTVAGLGTVDYVSTLSLYSTLSTFSTALGAFGTGSGDVTVANLRSTVAGLGTVDYVSTLSLYSTLSTFSTALGAFGTGSGDVTTANLVSTVEGLGTLGYVSSLSSLTISTLFNSGSISTYSLEVFGSNTLTNSGSTILRGGIYLEGALYVAGPVSGVEGTIVNALNLVSTTIGLETSGFLSTANLLELVSTANLLELVSTTNLLELVSTANLTNLVSTPNLLSLVSTSFIDTQLISTVKGLGTLGYVSSQNSLSISTGNIKAGNIEISTVTFKDTGNGELRILNSSNNALYFNGSAVGSGNVINNFNTSTYVFQVSSVSTIFAYDSVVISSATNVFLSPEFFSTVFFSTGAVQTSSIEFVDTQTSDKQLLAVENGILQLNGSPIQGDVSSGNLVSTTIGLQTSGFISSANLLNLVSTANLSNLVSTANLSNLVSTANLSNLVSTANLSNLVSTANLSNLVSTANLSNLVSTANLSNLVSTANLSNLVSTANLSNLVSTANLSNLVSTANLSNLVSTANLSNLVSTANLSNLVSTANLSNLVSTANLSNLISTNNLTSTVIGLSNVAVTKLVAGTNITLTPGNGIGEVTIDAAGGGGGGITTANLVSTVEGLGSSDYISSLSLVSSTQEWAKYRATSSIALAPSPDTRIVDMDNGTMTFNASEFLFRDINDDYRRVTLNSLVLKVPNPGISINDYRLGAYDEYVTGTISSFYLQYNTGAIPLQTAPLYLSSLYIGPAGGTQYGVLGTDDGTNLYWNDTQINGGGGGGITTANLVSTTFGLQSSDFISSLNLTSTVVGLSNIVVTKLVAGTNITLTPGDGIGEVTIDAAGGGGGGITTEQLTSTVGGIETNYFTSFSTNSLVLSSSTSNYSITTSTNTLTEQPYLWMNERIYGSYNPISLVISTLGDTDVAIFERDIGKYFLFTQENSGRNINFPTADLRLNGWNVVIKNMPDSTSTFTVNTNGSAVIAPGVATTVVCNGEFFYSL
jgi:hypothetical protein